ncbi:MAG TPA: type II secretion system F family protein [Gemmatimonadales bacterium]|nr:type II secretion system F family protein [Gemmatimonadales bacterium]
MTLLIPLLIGVAVAAVVGLAAWLVPARSRAVERQLEELEQASAIDDPGVSTRRQRQSQQLKAVLEFVGERVNDTVGDGAGRRARAKEAPAADLSGDPRHASPLRQQLIHAGYREPSAVAIYWGTKLMLTIGLGLLGFLLAKTLSGDAAKVLLAAGWGAALGWVGPSLKVRSRARARQKDIQRSLADALDLMVVCVEAGLALNQALVRVAEEIRHVSAVTSDELTLVNLEIRAGVPREEALRNLGDRTGVADLQSLVAMLVQTDRFGTSVAQALRVHSDTMRTKRRQRAEEAAAKTTIKLVFPLAFCIFPALFVVILGPALISIYRTLAGMK